MESKKFLLLSLQDLLMTLGYQGISIDTNLGSIWKDELEPVDFALRIEKRYEISISDDLIEEISKNCTLDILADKLLTLINK